MQLRREQVKIMSPTFISEKMQKIEGAQFYPVSMTSLEK